MVHTRGGMRGAARTLTHEHTAAGHTRGAACTRAANEVAEATRGLDVGRRRGSAAAHRQCRRAPRNCRAASAAPSAPTTRSRGAARKCCWPQRRSVGLFGERRGRRLAAVRDRAFRCGQPQVPMPKSAGVHRLQPQHRKRRKIRSPERAWDLTPGAGEARRRSASCGSALRETAKPRRQRRRLLLRLLLPLLSAAAPARL